MNTSGDGEDLDRRILDALGEHDSGRLAALRGDPRAALRLTSLEDLLASAAQELRSQEEREAHALEEAAHAVVGRVLARTTRNDLSWRADLRSLSDFIAERLSASRALRWVAASLVAHLAALPALAWYLQVSEERGPLQLSVALPEQVEERFEESVERLAPAASGDPDARGLELAQADNARRRARFGLGRARRSGDPEPRAALQVPVDEAALLGARVDYLEWGAWNASLERSPTGPSGHALVAVLWLELMLDRYVLEGSSPPDLALGLNDLERRLLRSEAGAPSERALGLACLVRAGRYGLWEVPEELGAAASPGRGLPLGPEWLRELGSALGSRAGPERERLSSLAGRLSP